MWNRKELIKTCLFFLLILALAGMSIILLINFNSEILFSNQNEDQYKIIHLIYPPQSSKSIVRIVNGSATDLPYLSTSILLHHQGTLSERDAVSVSATGYVYPPIGNAIIVSRIYNPTNPESLWAHNIIVGFEGAMPAYEMDPISRNGGEFIVSLLDAKDAPSVIFPTEKYMIEESSNKSTQFLRLPVLQTITWETQGDYYPYIIVFFENGTNQRQTYPDYKIHVSGSDVERQDYYSKTNLVLSIVLFAFTWITGLVLLNQIMPKWISRIVWTDEKPDNSSNKAPSGKKQETKTGK